MAEHLKPYQFQKGMEKIGGRQKGVRNKLSEAFLKDLHAEWERSGAGVLKILTIENPAVFAAITAKVIPTAFDNEHPATVHIVTGVVRHGEDYLDRPRTPQIPAAAVPALAPREDEFQED